MNRNVKRIGLILMIVALALTALTGCSKGGASIVGKWIPENTALISEDMLKELGAEKNDACMEFMKDGKILFTIKDKPVGDFIFEAMKAQGLPAELLESMKEEMTFDMSYKTDGDKITLSVKLGKDPAEEDQGTFKIDGDALTITDSKKVVSTFTKKK